MPRIANTTEAMIADIAKRLERLVEQAKKEGHEDALREVRSLVGGGQGQGGTGKERGRKLAKTARKPAKPKKKRKNPWDSYTPAQKAARVKKMLAGRGLKPKRK